MDFATIKINFKNKTKNFKVAGLYSIAVVLKVGSLGQQPSLPGMLLKMQILRPYPDLRTQNRGSGGVRVGGVQCVLTSPPSGV